MQAASGTISQVGGMFANGVPDYANSIIFVSGNYTGLQFAIFGSRNGGLSYTIPLTAIRYDDMAVVTGTLSPSNGTAHGYRVMSNGCGGVAVVASAITGGTVNVTIMPHWADLTAGDAKLAAAGLG